MKNSNEKLSVIIPVYNEAEHIAANIKEISKTLDSFECNYEIIAIDDCSEDDSFKILKALESELSHFIVKKNAQNYGKGRALKKAFRYTKGDLIVWLDADLDLHPLQISTLYNIMKMDNADVVIGSKMHPNSVVTYPLLRHILSLGYYSFIYMLFGLPCHDTQTGIKIFKREVLDDVLPRILVKKFCFDLEVLVNAHHLKYKIAEAPVVLESQRLYSRIGIRQAYETFLDTCAVWYRMYILRYYDNIDHLSSKGLFRGTQE
jgi:glycosyltransferase involved in cell wall biosynthesis